MWKKKKGSRLSRGRWRRFFSKTDPYAGIGDLLAHSGAKMSLSERMAWASRILNWLKPVESGSTGEARFRYFFNLLDQNPEMRRAFRISVAELVRDSSFLNFFLDTGYTNEYGLWTEAFNRLLNLLLPTAVTNDFRVVWNPVLREDEDFVWTERIPERVLAQFAELLSGDEFKDAWASVESDRSEALLMLSANIAHHGLSLGSKNRVLRHRAILDAPFFQLSAVLRRSVKERKISEELPESLKRCREEIADVYRHLEESGVSVGAVHKLETLSASLDRIQTLFELWATPIGTAFDRAIAAYIADTGRVAMRERSIAAHISRHFYLLSRKIAERNGQSGEHYIARSAKEMRVLFFSAFGGGLVVVGMTFFKILVKNLALPPIFEAIGLWIVYAAGFLAMQALGYTLATKIPSFAASRLAQWLRDARSKNDAKLFAREVGTVVKSQVYGLIGNVVAVVPFAWGIHYLFQRFLHFPPIVSPAYGAHFIHSMDPLAGPAVFLGAVTGMELWASSMCGGWFENFVVFRGIPEAIANHPRLVKIFGEKSAEKYGALFLKESSGVATNVSLGFLFGFVPLLGTLTGMNLESQHVTISTATTAFAVSANGAGYTEPELLWAGIGLGLVGAMNFVVSFFLALVVAVRAQNVRKAWVGHFLGSIWRRKR
jgi:site-specific recombinase